MTEKIKSDVSHMRVDKIVEKLSYSYEQLINKKIPLKTMPAVMLWGAPGVGKSQLVRQIAKEIEERTSKKVNVTDVRLLLFNPVDLRGIPTSNIDKTLAIWLKPKIFDMDGSENVVNILFLDEISSAPPSVQAAAYQITLDRVVGEHKLPENCIVICAGNRVIDKSVAYKMPRALANRLMHIEVDVSFNSWKSWAIKNFINKKVLGFLSFRQSYLYEKDLSTDSLAFTTPRSWEMVSNILNNISDDVVYNYELIAGLVGIGVAVEFRSWCNIYGELPNIKNIFNGIEENVPVQTDRLYALTSSMIDYARQNKEDLQQIENSIKYAIKMPPDFATVLLKGYQSIDKDFSKKLLTMPTFIKWFDSKGRLLNGIR